MEKQLKEQFFKKYSKEELLKDIENLQKGSGRLNKLFNHFFEEEMYKCKGGRGAYTPMQVLDNKELVDKIIEYTKSKPKFYVGNDIANIKSFFRNAGRIAQKVANFPIREAIDIYVKYSKEGDNVYDFSCGFGSRMNATLLSRRNYFGTDPNETLCIKLNECGKFLEDNGILNSLLINNKYKIYCQGSEDFIPELENTIDIAFSSPPYFDLEIYGDSEKQSVVKFSEYNNWLVGYVEPTVSNTVKYLKSGGYLLVNIKNMTSGKKYKLFDDWFSICSQDSNLEYIETINMKQLSKRDYKGKHFTGVNTDFGNSEPVMVFRKK